MNDADNDAEKAAQAAQDYPNINPPAPLLPPLTPLTPMAMLSQALAQGASLELVEKLMGLQERWEKNQARKAFEAAMAAAASEMPSLIKNRLVDYTSAKGRTRYQYEDLASVLDAVRPILGKHGLNVRFKINEEQERIVVTCRVVHADGFAEENSMSGLRDESGQKNPLQGKASAISYMSRYLLKASLGLAAGPDDDAQATTPQSPDKISAEQLAQILTLASDIADKGVMERMKTQLGIAALEEIPAAKFEPVLRKLRATKLAEETEKGASA